MDNQATNTLLDQALVGNKEALGQLLAEVQDRVFNLSLRMLGTVADAEDATQEIMIKVMTRLATFRRECAFSTWVFRIAVNHLKNDRKGQFANVPFSFEFYGEDIASGREQGVPDMSGGCDRTLLEQELKYACTNVMLQCLDAESRIIFILGTMFKLDSTVAGEILGITAEAYRQRLSRIRRKVADFLNTYCGLTGQGACRCAKRVDYAILTHRLDPQALSYVTLKPHENAQAYKHAMEELDELSGVFEKLPMYGITDKGRQLITEILHSPTGQIICDGGAV